MNHHSHRRPTTSECGGGIQSAYLRKNVFSSTVDHWSSHRHMSVGQVSVCVRMRAYVHSFIRTIKMSNRIERKRLGLLRMCHWNGSNLSGVN